MHPFIYGKRFLRVDDKTNRFCQLKIVFTSNIVTVIGPTPPGTGVYANTLELHLLIIHRHIIWSYFYQNLLIYVFQHQ